MKCKYWDCGFCYAPNDVVTSASSSSSCIYPEHCPYLKTEITNQQPEVMSSGTAIISDENGVPTKVHLSDKEKLTQMTFNNEIEEVKSQIQELQEKLKKLEHQEPVKQKDTLYQMLYDESAYGHIGLYNAFKVVKDWLYGNSITVTEDYSTVTLKLRKGAFGDAN